MAVAIDLGEPNSPFGDMHPRYKQQVGARLALASRAVAYKDPAVPATGWTGPLASLATSVKGALTVSFVNTGEESIHLKHGVGFEYSPHACNVSFPDVEKQGTWFEATVASTGGSDVTLSTGTGHAQCVRYNWYNAACMPTVGPELCAIYGQGALGQWLPAPPFILDAVPHHHPHPHHGAVPRSSRPCEHGHVQQLPSTV